MCGCKEGYKLSNDSKTCVDINECEDDIKVCTHECHNTKGSFVCKCGPGFTLRPDRVTCSAGGILIIHFINCFNMDLQNKDTTELLLV